MAITITKFPGAYSFLGNSIHFELTSDSADPVDVEILSSGQSKFATFYPFRKEGLFRVRMNLADYLSFDTEFVIPSDEIVAPVTGFSMPYQVKIGENYTFQGIAFRGGVSNYAFKQLAEQEHDLFSWRLMSSGKQFLFTTRTHSQELRLRETELYPFLFIHPGIPVEFRAGGEAIVSAAQPPGTVCAMDVKTVLSRFPAGTQRIDVYLQNAYCFHFRIDPGKIAEERYLIRFKNSLAAFEVVEVTGRATHAPEFGEESAYNTLTEFDFYEERRSRLQATRVIEVETGHKDRRELPFILDLIQSDESYFIFPDGTSFRCMVSSESARFRHLMTEPTSFPLKVKEVTGEDFYTPEIKIELDDFSIFDDSFDDLFE